jgi:SAM-dependent methyltransferase
VSAAASVARPQGARLTLMTELLKSGLSPSGALWRHLEVGAVKEAFERAHRARPVLELGCGDGTFTRLSLGMVEMAIDIDSSAVDRARREVSVYGSVECRDAKDLLGDSLYGTVLANCVLEHITGVDEVLEGCCRALRPGGNMIATVPLVAMNDHLLLRSPRYAAKRQRQLIHHNLWTCEEWAARLRSAGFDHVDAFPYLYGSLCRTWDLLDAVTWVGVGRYRSGKILRYKSRLPRALNDLADRWMARRLVASIGRHNQGGVACAALLFARKSASPAHDRLPAL